MATNDKPRRAKWVKVRGKECVAKKVKLNGETIYSVKIETVRFPERFTNVRDAVAFRDQLRGEAQNGVRLGIRSTVRQYWEEVWIPHKEASGDVKAHVLDEYRSAFRAHIEPAFGDKRLTEVGPLDVERFFDDLKRKGRAAYTILNIRTPLNGLFDHATDKRVIPYNPVGAVKPPKAKARRKPYIPTLAEVWRLAKAATSGDDHNLVLASPFTGLRQSELFGLRWANVYLEPGAEYVLVVEQFYQGRLVPTTKTDAGTRPVPLNDDAAAVLRAQTKSTRPNPLGLVFPSINGTHIRASNWNRRVWQPLREAAGMPELHFHDLRHFLVSTLDAIPNLPKAWRMELVGHADDRTHERYTHALPGWEGDFRTTMAGRFAEPDDDQASVT